MPLRSCPHCKNKFVPDKEERIYCSRKCYFLNKTKSVESRFWSKVKKTKSCWIWKSCKINFGYGYFHFKHGKSPAIAAHRMAWILTRGSIPNTMCVLHRCDNPPCVNPSHLFIGTDGDNIQDAMKKRRWIIGSRNGHSKFKESEIIKIRNLVFSGKLKQFQVAKLYGVTTSCISNIIGRKNWIHI